eukprot:CCRYP_012331-RB/>CCRYP_012331-RB protein AED:0.03 eAED:0.03 QI:95/1/1/1/1/1/10/663/1892
MKPSPNPTHLTNATKPSTSPASREKGDDPSSDEDSIKLVWQDDAGTDLRSLFAKDMMTMTQQIDGGETENDSEDDGNGELDCRKSAVGSKKSNLLDEIECKQKSDGTADSCTKKVIALTHKTAKANKHKQRKKSLPQNIKIGENLTPPPNDLSARTNALHSADTPATISKLKRRRRSTRNTGLAPVMSESDPSSGPVASASTGAAPSSSCTAGSIEKRQKLSASQEVDRVFNFLGLPETHQRQTLESVQELQSQPMHHSTSSALKALSSMDHSVTSSPMKQMNLFSGISSVRVTTQVINNSELSRPAQQLRQNRQVKSLEERQKLKLPPLRPNVGNYRTRVAGKENETNNTHVNHSKEMKTETRDAEDLFKAVELGLDCVANRNDDEKCVSIVPLPAAGATAAEMSNKQALSNIRCNSSMGVSTSKKDHALSLKRRLVVPEANKYDAGVQRNQNFCSSSGVSNTNAGQAYPTVVSKPGLRTDDSDRINHGSECDVNSFCRNSAEHRIHNTPNQINQYGTTKTEETDSELGMDDDWNEEDIAAIDRTVALTQSKAQNGIVSNINRFEDEFGDDDDELLAAIDLSGAVAQSYANENIGSNVCEDNHNAATASNVALTNTSEFSDDDFADFDFDAIDSTVAQHQMQLSAQTRHMIPTHNRRSQVANDALSFTRYVITSIDENLDTRTKSLGVALQSGEETKAKYTDEFQRLREYQHNESVSSVDGTTSVTGYIHLRGIWYYTKCLQGDVIHLISISGQYATDVTALPVILDSKSSLNESNYHDDLILVIHPDELITPTLISEAVKCPRLSVLQSRLGSTGLSARSAVIGTLRHDLFERCLQEQNASLQSAALYTRQIIRDHAETLVGCGITDQQEAFSAVMKTLPQIQKFLRAYTSWDASKTGQMKSTNNYALSKDSILKGEFASSDTLFSIKEIYSIEEMTMCPELGLKGFVDATVVAQTKPLIPEKTTMSSASHGMSLMPLELKTGHSQSIKSNHSAQLAVYTMLLRSRYGTSSANNIENTSVDVVGLEIGAACSGVLLYLNDESFHAIHVNPTLEDLKQLIGQRNDVACDALRAARPRGITIEYKEDGRVYDTRSRQEKNGEYRAIIHQPPPSVLPPLNPKVSECEKCYKSRECMMYASSSTDSNVQFDTDHRRLAQHFTSHLNGADLDYFRKWDRLIDLERHAHSNGNITKSWLRRSNEKERMDGNSISSLILDLSSLTQIEGQKSGPSSKDHVALRFGRACDAENKIPLHSLNVEVGNFVLLSTDSTLFSTKMHSQHRFHSAQQGKHKMHLSRGFVAQIREQDIDVSVSKNDIVHIKRCIDSSTERLKFRLDKDELSNGTGLLFQNLVNFLTLDIPAFSTESMAQTPSKTKSMTCNTEDSRRRRRLQSCITQLYPPPRFEQLSACSLFESTSFTSEVAGCDLNTLRKEFGSLNCGQKEAILKVVSAKDFALIQGLPGTGKSATVSFLTRLLVARGKRVLLTSYTHSAVDNLLLKLFDSGLSSVISNSFNLLSPIVRIGREASCHPRVHSVLAQNIACMAERASSTSGQIDTPNVDFLHKVVSSAKIVGVTALTAPRSPLLSGQHFDFVIVDEAGQINQPACLGAITSAEKFVLVGDHMQLPPLTRSQVAEQAGFGVSMLSHLAEGFPDSVAKLTTQYRMHEDIQHLSNIIAYDGLLKCGNETVKHSLLQLKHFPLNQQHMINSVDQTWINHAIAPANPVVFIDTDGLRSSWQNHNHSIFKGLESDGPVNTVEAAITERLVVAFSSAGLDASSVGVITPFRSQLRVLNDSITIRSSINDGLELGTVDIFQGRDKETIILSLVRSNSEGKAGRLLQDFRRLNVAFSRAKRKIVIVGSFSTLYAGSDVIRPVLDSIRQRNWIHRISYLSINDE